MNLFRTTLCQAIAWVGALLAVGCEHAQSSWTPGLRIDGVPPSVILISLDTVRLDHTGLHGYGRETTPNLVSLAAESVVFERAYTTWAWTLIAHMSLLTGLYPSQHGVYTKQSMLPTSFPTLAERLKSAGYHTMGFYKPGWLDPRYGTARGFDIYEPHETAEEAEGHWRAAMSQRPMSSPFLLFIHLFDAHNKPLAKGRTMYEPPEPYDVAFLPDPKGRLSGIDPRLLWKKGDADLSDQQREALVALYDGGIRYVDDKVGTWVEEWRASGLLDRTILIITSDHGEGLAERSPAWGEHGGHFEEGLRAPLLVRFPDGYLRGVRVQRPVSHIDLLPTLLECLGMEEDDRLPGFSMLRSRPRDVPIFAEHPRKDSKVVLVWPWKLALRGDLGKYTICNLDQDPLEGDTVTQQSSPGLFETLAAPLRAAAMAERERFFVPLRSSEEGSPGIDAAQEARLDALGYGGDD